MGAVLVAFLASLVLGLYKLRNVGRRPKDFPPGPPTLPIIGNLHLMSPLSPHLQFKKWADEYGPIYSLVLGSSVMIVLSSDQAVKDLLDKRSNIYSSRPPIYIANVISGYKRLAFMGYGTLWRKLRGAVHEHLNIRAATSYIPYQDLESRRMLVGMLDQPGRWRDQLRRYTTSLTTQMVYGARTTSVDDENMHEFFDGFAEVVRCCLSLEALLLDFFPFLQKLPDIFLPVMRRAKRMHEQESVVYMKHWMTAKKKILEGTSHPCMCTDLVIAQEKEDFSDLLFAYVSGSMLEAGSDTTWNTLVGWVQAMVLFPDVARKAQQEVDSVCGNRMPTLEDVPNMQYIRSSVKESIRWMPTAPLGIPHSVLRDDMYNGYRIPKGATVTLNVWGINNDGNRYLNPRKYNPSRYEHDDLPALKSALLADPTKRDHYSFGAGRRICPGMHIAERSLFLTMSRLLWAFDIKPAEDDVGNQIWPDPDDLTEGLAVQPSKFPAVFVPRTEERTQLLREGWAKAEEELDEQGQWKKVPEGLSFHEYVPLVK